MQKGVSLLRGKRVLGVRVQGLDFRAPMLRTSTLLGFRVLGFRVSGFGICADNPENPNCTLQRSLRAEPLNPDRSSGIPLALTPGS